MLAALIVGFGALAPTSSAAAPKRADLVVATTPGTLVAQPGGALATTVSVRNRGRATAPGSRVGLYLSRDARLSPADRLLVSGRIGALAPGQTRQRSLTGRLPQPLATGTWRILACADLDVEVRQSSTSNDCRVHRSLDVAQPGPPPSGPSGGAESACGGAVVPYSQGTTPPAGVRFEVTPASPDGVLGVSADPVGAEFDFIEQYAQTTLTITNVGTETAPGVTAQADACVPGKGAPGYWGGLDLWDDQVEPARRCGSNGNLGALPPGRSCDVQVWASDIVRGGANPGYLRLTTGVDVVAVFPITVDSASRGYLRLQVITGSDDLRDNAPGRHRRVLVRATSIGDRDAVPSFSFTDHAGVFEIDGSYTPPSGTTRCAVTYSASSGTYVGAVSPGGSCVVAIDVCSALSSVDYTTRLFASRIDGARQSDDLPLRYTTTSGPAEQPC